MEVPDFLMRRAKEYAARHGIPLRLVFERGLEMALAEKRPAGKPFRMRVITSKGRCLTPEGDWNAIRSLIYEGHGG